MLEVRRLQSFNISLTMTMNKYHFLNLKYDICKSQTYAESTADYGNALYLLMSRLISFSLTTLFNQRFVQWHKCTFFNHGTITDWQ